MMRNMTSRVLVSILTLGCLAGVGLAQTGPTGRGGAAVPGQVLGQEGVVAHLKRLDPGMRLLNKSQNWTYYAVTLKGKDRNYIIEAAANNGYVFLNCYLGRPIAPQNLSSAAMVKMLKLNTSIGPTYFHIVQLPEGLQLTLTHRLDVTVTPARFQAGLDEFLGDINNSAPVWSEVLKNAGQ
jgi:hypothetical protein